MTLLKFAYSIGFLKSWKCSIPLRDSSIGPSVFTYAGAFKNYVSVFLVDFNTPPRPQPSSSAFFYKGFYPFRPIRQRLPEPPPPPPRTYVILERPLIGLGKLYDTFKIQIFHRPFRNDSNVLSPEGSLLAGSSGGPIVFTYLCTICVRRSMPFKKSEYSMGLFETTKMFYLPKGMKIISFQYWICRNRNKLKFLCYDSRHFGSCCLTEVQEITRKMPQQKFWLFSWCIFPPPPHKITIHKKR